MTSAHAPSNVAKTGWLLRQSSILHRWKKSYVVFYTDGRLAYFDDDKTTVAEDVIDIPRDKAIILGPEYCKDVNPPTEKSHNLLFGVKTRSKSVYFCAENEDELAVWKFALQEAFNIQAHYRTVGPEHCQQFTYHVPPGSTIVVDENGPAIHTPDGRVIMVCQDPYFRDYAYGPDYCSAMLTGAALGTLMFWPWWFFWF